MKAVTGPQSISFSGHESFPLRFAWPTKAVRHCGKDPSVFGRPDAVVTLGVGKNMVRSMRHWAARADLIHPTGGDRRGGAYSPTELGEFVFGERGTDPYMEDPGTSWLIHWQLCSDPQRSPTTWYYLFNNLRGQSFTGVEAVSSLWRLVEEAGIRKTSRGTIERDVACFVRSYTSASPDKKISQEDTYDSPLTDLGLLRKEPESDRIIIERSTRPTLPLGIIAYAVTAFWDRVARDSNTLSFEHLAYAPGSPGQVFQLSENALIEYLESIHSTTRKGYSFSSTAGMRQLIRSRKATPLTALRYHYDSAQVAHAE
jgi:hypothetical protein